MISEHKYLERIRSIFEDSSQVLTFKFQNSILVHLVDSGYHIDIKTAFKVIYRITNRTFEGQIARALCTAEAVAITFLISLLCIQKRFAHHLGLPMPEYKESSTPYMTRS